MDEIFKALVQQQSTLQGLVEMQADIRCMMQKQHRILEGRLAGLCQSLPSEEPAVALLGSDGNGATPMPSMKNSFSFNGCGPHGDLSLAPLKDSVAYDLPMAPGEWGHPHDKASICSGLDKDQLLNGARTPPTGAGPGGPAQTTVNVFRAKTADKAKKSESSSQVEPLTMPRKPSDLRQCLRKFLGHPLFDSSVGVLVLLHFVLIFSELELKGQDTAYQLDLKDSPSSWLVWKQVFYALDKAFSVVWLAELIIYLYAFRLQHFRERDWIRIIDVMAVGLSVLDSFLLIPALGTADRVDGWMRAVKVVKVCRLFRFVRVLRFMGMISTLRIFVETLSKSLGSLIYTMSVVGFIIVSSAMFLSTIVQDVLEDDALSTELRHWLYDYYGGAFRCTYTMFEASFSAKWATHFSDRLIWEVSPAFAIFWVSYTVTVNFAVIRVLAALFLKQTLDVAAIDAERIAFQKLKEREAIMDTLRAIFKLGDVEGDGFLHRWEFDAMMENEKVLAMFETLELEVPELQLLFNILSEDDGVADQEEFLTGALKLKTQVKTVDIVQLLHEQLVIKRWMGEIAKGLQHMDSALHPKNTWSAMALHVTDEQLAVPSTVPSHNQTPPPGPQKGFPWPEEAQPILLDEEEEDEAQPMKPPSEKGVGSNDVTAETIGSLSVRDVDMSEA